MPPTDLRAVCFVLGKTISKLSNFLTKMGLPGHDAFDSGCGGLFGREKLLQQGKHDELYNFW